MSGAGEEGRSAGPASRSVDPLELLVVIGRARRWLWTWPLAAAVVAAGVSLVLPERFTATTRLMPIQQAQSSAAAMLSSLGGLAGVAGGALGIKNPGDLHVAMLRSTTVADALIARHGLKALYEAEFDFQARKALEGDTRIQADKSGLITIEVEASSAQLAAELANAYVAELHRLTSTLAVTEAAQRRAFFEQQLQQTKDRLAEAEAALRRAIDAGGLVSVDAQSRVAVEAVARLRAEIGAKEIQARAMRAYATPSHPDLRRAEQELASMRRALQRLESGEAGAADGAGGPASGLANIRLVREVKYQEVLMELLARQYELARVDESKEAPLVQVLDPAQPPERRSSPKRTRLVLLTAAAGLLAAVLAALVRGGLERLARDPARADMVARVRAAWRRRTP